jgi:hypothetical protein
MSVIFSLCEPHPGPSVPRWYVLAIQDTGVDAKMIRVGGACQKKVVGFLKNDHGEKKEEQED